uniref:Uncharacterized protein n=1 Tax=Tetradesmus obliquus TaxID=3088 RepID=A0A383V8T4_TETOB|eukprot:jgi/Sobl393_1/6473/SZX61363.1
MLLQADPGCLQQVLVQLLQHMAASQDASWYDEAPWDSDVSSDNDEEPVYVPGCNSEAAVVAVLLGVAAGLEAVPLQLRQMYSALGLQAGQLLDCSIQLTEHLLNDQGYPSVVRRASLAVLALARMLQTADAGCLQQLLPPASSMLDLAQGLLEDGMDALACEWCGVLAWLWRAAEQLQLPCSTAAGAGASPGQQPTTPCATVAAGTAAVLTSEPVYGMEEATAVAAMRALGVLASSAIGRQAIAAAKGNWGQVVDALWFEVRYTVADADDAMQDDDDFNNQAAAAYLRSYPATNNLLAAARAAAAAGEEPPCLQHLLVELKRLQDDDLETAEPEDEEMHAVHAQLRWLICQSCSIAGSYRAGQMALMPLKPALMQLLQQLPPGDAAVLEGALAAAEAGVQQVRGELQQAQLAVQQACQDAAETHIPFRAAVRQLALFDACMQRVAAKEARAAELEHYLQRATAPADNVYVVVCLKLYQSCKPCLLTGYTVARLWYMLLLLNCVGSTGMRLPVSWLLCREVWMC